MYCSLFCLFIFINYISHFLLYLCFVFLFSPLPFLKFIGRPVESHFLIHCIYLLGIFCNDWTISEPQMSVYFTYRYYTAKQSDVREGNIREEVYLQDQWCKWENVLRHIALSKQILTCTEIQMHCVEKGR